MSEETSVPAAREAGAETSGSGSASASAPASASGSASAEGPAAPVPSVREVLRAAPGRYLLHTVVLGLGVASSWCFGLGLLIAWWGCMMLLAETARAAGVPEAKPSSAQPILAGFLAMALAFVLACAGMLGLVAARPTTPWAIGPVFIAACASIAVMGAALAPLAFAPIASACGTSGYFAPIARATDLAGTDRLVVLAPLCAGIALAVLVPVPLVLGGIVGAITGSSAAVAIGVIALVAWMLAVPVSAATLTVRYLRLQRQNDAPTRIGQALAPVLGAFAIGAVALGASLATLAATPVFVQESEPGAGGQLIFAADGASEPINGTALTARAGYRRLIVQGPSGRHEVRLDHGLGADVSFPWAVDCWGRSTPDGGLRVWCVESGLSNGVRVDFDPEGRPIPIPLGTRLSTSLGTLGAGAIALALLTLALALLWLGRIGASLRLLAKPPFALEGTADVDARGVAFLDRDGQHRVHIPSSRILGPRPPANEERVVLLATAPPSAMTFRAGTAEAPSGALLVVGTREDALAARIVHARKIGFRFAVVALGLLVTASVVALVGL